MQIRSILLPTTILLFLSSSAQQVADSAFTFPIQEPAYPSGKGPLVTIDEAHYNFHTLDGRYYPFAKLLREDGYQLRAGKEKFTREYLSQTNILVIANALPDDGEWVLPTLPAFTDDEVKAVEQFVKDGGSLFLIADHMPCPGAAENLAAIFGFKFINGFAMTEQRPERFTRIKGTLKSSPVTDGRTSAERVDSIIIFTGQGFVAPPQAQPFLLLDTSYTILLPHRAWEFDENTPSLPGKGYETGACMEYGKGRIVMMGEAAMFSAQLAGPQRQKMGMNHPEARRNPQLLLNIVHWLSGLY